MNYRDRLRYLFSAAPDDTDSLPLIQPDGPVGGYPLPPAVVPPVTMKMPVLVRRRVGKNPESGETEARWFVLCPAGNAESFSEWRAALFVAHECYKQHGVTVVSTFFDDEEQEMEKLGIKRPAMNGAYVTSSIARHVLHYTGDKLGQDGGHFLAALFVLFELADSDNLDKLRENFPAYVQAWEAAMRTTWGMEWLRQVARGAEA